MPENSIKMNENLFRLWKHAAILVIGRWTSALGIELALWVSKQTCGRHTGPVGIQPDLRVSYQICGRPTGPFIIKPVM